MVPLSSSLIPTKPILRRLRWDLLGTAFAIGAAVGGSLLAVTLP